MNSFLYRPPREGESRWNELGRRRMRADYLRLMVPAADPGPDYAAAQDGYDRGGLPYERALTRLGYSRWLLGRGDVAAAREANAVTLDLARRHGMRIVEADALELEAAAGHSSGAITEQAKAEAVRVREEAGYRGPGRP
jgi:hypothetical protein